MFNQTRIFIVKVASRCNLACSYCYMYFHPDQSWKKQPKFISKETVGRLGSRLNEHLLSLNGGKVMVVAHGGEPLLHPDLDYFFGEIKRTVGNVEFAIQTNGTLFNEKTLAILNKYSVHIGVSIDGNREAH